MTASATQGGHKKLYSECHSSSTLKAKVKYHAFNCFLNLIMELWINCSVWGSTLKNLGKFPLLLCKLFRNLDANGING